MVWGLYMRMEDRVRAFFPRGSVYDKIKKGVIFFPRKCESSSSQAESSSLSSGPRSHVAPNSV